MEGGIRQPDHPMTKECRVGTQLHGQGVKRSFDDSKQFSRLFTSRVQGISIASLYFVEVFSGTAGLTAEVRRLGCQRSTGIGAHVTKQVKAPVKRLDLSNEAGQTLLWRILKDPRVFAAHLGPHVGHLPGPGRSVKSFGLHPLPLRSDKFPDGLANLPPRDQAHVDTANKLYKFSREILAYCTKHGIICSLENPARSHMWNMPFLKSPLQGLSSQLQEVLFHHCMLGSKRRKRTKLLVNHCCFSHFRRECENAHEHDAWGTLPQGGQLLMKWSTHMGYVESGQPV